MLYFNQKPYSPTTSEQAKQLAAVLQFKEKIQNEAEGIYGLYDTLEEFKEKVYDHLSDYIVEKFNSPVQQPSTSDKLSLVDKRQVIYNDIVRNIFSPLIDYELETPYDYPISRLKLSYDLSSLKGNPDYEEAKLHWKQDLKDIGIDPEVIESQVETLNTDVDRFFTSQLTEPVIAAIQYTTTDGKLKAFESEIGIPRLLRLMKHFR